MHSVLFVCALLVLMVSNSIAIKTNSSTIPDQEGKIRLACPLEGIDFLGYDLNGGGGLVTSTWEECGNIFVREKAYAEFIPVSDSETY